MNRRIPLSLTALVAAVALSACGGGASGSGVTPDASKLVHGVIAGFGSTTPVTGVNTRAATGTTVLVNGVEFTVPNGITIAMDGVQQANQAALQVGMVVNLTGSINADGVTGTAQSIDFRDELEGFVTANTVGANGIGTLTVMGQTVEVDADTIFDSRIAGITTPDLLAVGNIVEVSGYPSPTTGSIYATRIELKSLSLADHDGEVEVKGTVSGLDTAAMSFQLGGLPVSYDAQTPLPFGGLADGQYVQVKTQTAYTGSGSLLASEIELEDGGSLGHHGNEGDDFKVMGLVTADYSAASGRFELNGNPVQVTDRTEFKNGDVTGLVTGTRIKVESQFAADGSLIAQEVKFAERADTEIAGVVEAVDTTARTVTVMGQTIQLTNTTVMKDDSQHDVYYFSLADLQAQDYVKLNLYDAAGVLTASKLERDDYRTTSKLKGIATVNGSNWSVAGITIDVSSVTTLPPVSSGQTVVEVKGSWDSASGMLLATQISLDD